MFAKIAIIAMTPLMISSLVPLADGPVDLKCRVTYELQARPADDGYDHVVAFDSACEHRLACTVTNDEGHEALLTVPAEGRAAVVIDEGEASTTFEAQARCQPVPEA